MAGFGFLTRGSYARAEDIMEHAIKELKRETGTTQMIDAMQQRLQVRFTYGGLLLVLAPVIEGAFLQDQLKQSPLSSAPNEVFRRTADLELPTVQKSLELIFTSARDHPNPLDGVFAGQEPPIRTSLSVLRAVHRTWCDIPPCCSPS